MIDQAAYFDIIQGARRGMAATAARFALSVARGPYGAAVSARNRYYDGSDSRAQRAGVPVISVGNLTLGGTGKTPFIAWLAKWFRARDLRVAIVSRGYKAKPGESNDEALQLEQQLPDVPHLQNTKRIEAARMAVEQFESQLILLDDGFQHRQLHRDLDIVLLDATQPFGMHKLFPRGTLREPLSSLQRAKSIVLTRSDQISEAQRKWIKTESMRHAPQATWTTASHVPIGLCNVERSLEPLNVATGMRWFAFCGIGNASAFRRTLHQAGYPLVGFRQFPDHHHYSREDIDQLAVEIRRSTPRVDGVICTEKDLVKICADQIAARPLYALAIEMQIQSGLQPLEEQLEKCGGKP